jgi:hypothetical protein
MSIRLTQINANIQAMSQSTNRFEKVDALMSKNWLVPGVRSAVLDFGNFTTGR